MNFTNLKTDVSHSLHLLQQEGQKVSSSTIDAVKSALDKIATTSHHVESSVKGFGQRLPGAVTAVNTRIENAAVMAFHKTNQEFASAAKMGVNKASAVAEEVLHQAGHVLSGIWTGLPAWLKVLVAIVVAGAIMITLKGGKTAVATAQQGIQFVKENPQILAAPLLI